MEHKNLNEERAYALAALQAGVEFIWSEERNKWGAAPNEGPTVWVDNFSEYHMVEDYAAAGKALGLHEEARSILQGMAEVPEGYVLVKQETHKALVDACNETLKTLGEWVELGRDMSELNAYKGTPIVLSEGDCCQVFTDIESACSQIGKALADALGKKEEPR